MSYLETKFPQYRCIAEYDLTTNDFPREYTGQLCDNDIYIKCHKNIKIYYFGRGILEAYIPSLGRGRNILKAIRTDNISDIIFNIQETDEEVLFRFKAQDMNWLEKYLSPITSGCNISAHSVKNLPKNKTYKIPDEELLAYKSKVQNLPQKDALKLGLFTNNYIKSLATKSRPFEDIKADMRKKMLKGKEYIHSIGKWKDYLDYIEREIMNYGNN